MAGSISDYAENKLLDHVLKTASYTQPTNLYIAVSTADPTDSGGSIAEPVGNGYARKLHNAWDTASARATENTGAITFNAATGSWGTITHWAIFDALSGGNMIAHGDLDVANAVVDGNIVSFADGEIDISFNAGGATNYLANKLLDHVFGNTAYTVPTSLHLALSTTTPADDGTNITEPAGGSYARLNHDSWDAASNGATENTGAATFVTATGSWGTITHVVIFDAASSGNALIHAALDASQAVVSGNIIEYADGAFDITLN